MEQRSLVGYFSDGFIILKKYIKNSDVKSTYFERLKYDEDFGTL